MLVQWNRSSDFAFWAPFSLFCCGWQNSWLVFIVVFVRLPMNGYNFLFSFKTKWLFYLFWVSNSYPTDFKRAVSYPNRIQNASVHEPIDLHIVWQISSITSGGINLIQSRIASLLVCEKDWAHNGHDELINADDWLVSDRGINDCTCSKL